MEYKIYYSKNRYKKLSTSQEPLHWLLKRPGIELAP